MNRQKQANKVEEECESTYDAAAGRSAVVIRTAITESNAAVFYCLIGGEREC